MKLLIATTLAFAGCSDSTACPPDPNPEGEPFTLDEDLDDSAVQDLLDEHGQSDPAMLACDDVCRSRYSEQHNYSSRIVSIETCKLMIDGELTGDPDEIVGALYCEGHSSGYICTGGRRPIGHIEHQLPSRELPDFLAHGARLEAASVLAFSQLAERLQAWGAPGTLVDRCHKAAAEEAQHADLLGALARAAGNEVAPATQHHVAVDLVGAALDNAIEGCVREAWSALACAVSARRARSSALRLVYQTLAVDEASHAQLAWDLHEWFMDQLSPDQRATIVAAQNQAIADLPALARAQQRSAPSTLSLPSARTAIHFAAGLARATA